MPQNQDTGVLAIIGQGYVGLPLAMAAATAGWRVIGIDSSETKILGINDGKSPVEDVEGFQITSAISAGKYSATSDFSKVASASVVAICVPTPLDANRNPDTSILESATQSISPYLKSETLVISESTSYPGTLRNLIIPIVERLKNPETSELRFASAPERVNPGDKKWSMANTPRLVGGIDNFSTTGALDFYKTFCLEVVRVESPEIAEAAKLLENTFRLVNIALINEFTQICDAAGINVHEVVDAASTKPYGYMPFRPGVGVGGHCIPVDPLYLTWWSDQQGATANLVLASDKINSEMPEFVAKKALAMTYGKTETPKVLILGVAYKPGISDIRETPTNALRNSLIASGAHVGWIDPLVHEWNGEKPVDYDWDCDVAIVATNQPGLDLKRLIEKNIKILDCTNSYGGEKGVTLL
jgi:UDP-N-acetyl-D-glucosamine dehydrogenase